MKHTFEWNGNTLEVNDEDCVIVFPDMQGLTAMMYMPGYDGIVMIPVNGPGWFWNGDKKIPTFSPSILDTGGAGRPRNHVFVREGIVEYLQDCGHELAGKKIPLPMLMEWPEEWKLWKED